PRWEDRRAVAPGVDRLPDYWFGRSQLHLRQILMHELDGYGTLANAGSHPLHRAVAYVPDRKHTRQIGFEERRIAVEGPASGTFSVKEQVGAGEDESTRISGHHAVQPIGDRLRADKDKYRRSANLAHLSGTVAADRYRLQPVSAMGLHQLHAILHLDVRRARA